MKLAISTVLFILCFSFNIIESFQYMGPNMLKGTQYKTPQLLRDRAVRQGLCEQRLEEDINLVIKKLRREGYSPEKLSDARLYMDLVAERYRIQVELLIMDRTAFSSNGLGARLRAPFIVYGDCKDNSLSSTLPIDYAVAIKESDTPCKRALKIEVERALKELKNLGQSDQVLVLAKYYMDLVEQLQLINIKIVTMDRVVFPSPSVQGQFQDPFIPYERCKSIPIVDPR